MDIKPRSRSRGSSETAAASAGSSPGEMPDLLASASTFTINQNVEGRQIIRALCGQTFSNAQTIHRLHPIEALGNHAALIGCSGPMKCHSK